MLFLVDCFSWWLIPLYIWRSLIVSIYKFDLSLWKFWRPNRWCFRLEKLWANLLQKPGCYLPETTLSPLKRSRPCRTPLSWVLFKTDCLNGNVEKNFHAQSISYLLCLLSIHYLSQGVCSLRGWYRIRLLDIRYLILCGLGSVLKICFFKDLNFLWQRILWNILSTALPEVENLHLF